MQNAADGGGGVFYQCEEYACMLHIISLWLVPIFHGVKYAKCEIWGTTKLGKASHLSLFFSSFNIYEQLKCHAQIVEHEKVL